MRRPTFLAALLLAGCAAPAYREAMREGAPQSAPGGWRMLSLDAGQGQAPRPLGYLEVRQVACPDGEAGTVYMIYDEGFRPVGHVTEGGNALRYRRNPYDEDRPLGRRKVPDQLSAVLGVDGRLHIFDLKGQPKELP